MASVAAIMANPAFAQAVEQDKAAPPTESIASDEPALGDIVVTAQRREQRSQNVGISITAFSGEQLTQLGVSSSQDLVAITPGLRNPQSGSGLTASFSLRGLSQSDFGASQEAPVALYVDDVYQSSQGASQFLLFDVARTEVLRGPQGTLFGRNATGGLVHFITERPKDDFGGYVDLSYGRFNRIRPEAAINLPIGATTAIRISAAGEWHDAFVKNTAGADLYDANRWGGRLQFQWKPSDDITLLLSGRIGRVRETGQPYIWDAARPTGPLGTGEFSPGLSDNFGFTNTGNGPFRVTLDPIAFHDTDTQGVTGSLSWTLGDVTVTSLTDFTEVQVKYAEDSDMQPGEYFHYLADQRSKQFSQELRLSGETGALNWTVGGYYLWIGGDYVQEGRLTDLFGAGSGVSTLTSRYDVTTHSVSAFGQLEYKLTDQLKAIVGARYIDERKRQNYNSAFYDLPGGSKVGFGSSPDLLNFNGRMSQGLYSLRAELDWKPSEGALFYASYNRGVKSGGFNAPLDPSGSAVFIDPLTFDPAPTAADAMRFKPEVLHSYEVGAKIKLPNGLGRINASAFYYDYKDFQALSFEGVSTSYIINRPATLKGIDTELYLTPARGLNLIFGASYLDQVVKGIPLSGTSVDRKIPYAPQWNLTALARYEWDAFGGQMALQANTNYVSSQNFALTNAAVTEEPGYALVNARLSYTFPNDRLTIAAYVDNLTDRRYRLIAFDLASSFGSSESQYGMPRTYGVSLRYKFGE
jgi:iron complex outermembrane receptor protein